MMRISAFAVLTVVATGAEAADYTSSTAISAVTVFPDQAQVTRTATIKLEPGEHTVVIGDLPYRVEPETVRVEAVGDGGIEIGSVDLRDVVPLPQEVRLSSEAEQQIQTLQSERAALDDRIKVADQQRDLIDRLAKAASERLMRGLGDGKIQPAQLKETWGLVGDGTAVALGAIREAQVRQKAIDDEIQRIRKGLARDPQGARPHSEARVAIVVRDKGEATFRITYRMARAGWQPVYDARLTTATAGVKPVVALVTRAFVHQETGENWSDVALTLSTARPSKGTSAPEIKPLLVQLWVPPPIGGVVLRAPSPSASLPETRALARSKVTADEAAKPESVPPAPPKIAEEQKAQVEVTGTTVVYRIPGKVGVDTGTGGRSLKVGEVQQEALLSVKAAPKQVATAYLTASFRPKGDASLLPGAVSIYRDGQFVGTGAIPFVASGDDIKLGFGEDDKVKVERVAVKQTEGETGTFTTSRVETRDFKIKVKNLHDVAVPITIEDQIPVSESTDLIVEKLSTLTPPTKSNVDDRRGVLAWSFDLKPAEEKEIKVGWRIKYPAERTIGWANVDK